MNEPLIQLRRVSRRRSQAFCLRIDDWNVRPAEVMALVGPTGAGKTTLLRLLTGVDFPEEGAVQFNGAPLTREAALPRLRDIAMVHQRPILLSGSVESNVAFGLRVRGARRTA